MKIIRNIVATAIAASLGLAGTTANAINLGEVWTGDQENGFIYIHNQSELNDPSSVASEVRVDLNAAANNCANPGDSIHGSRCADRMHIIGFSNHAGLDPDSRAVFGYLDGVAEIWASNGGTRNPTKITELQVLGGAVGGAASLHMCGPSPDNSLIACASLGGRKAIIFSADMANDNYTRLGDWDINPADMPISPRLKGKAKKTVEDEMAAINALSANPNAICNNFSTDSKALYYTVQTSSSSGGVVVLDVNDPANPTILDAWQTPNADGCGLVNSPDGSYMWINHGHNTAGDDELATKWDNNRYTGSKVTKVGPVAIVDIPEVPPVQIEDRSGDVHGAQFAGLGGLFLWEVMRIDDRIHVINHNSSNPGVVNTIDLETDMGLENPQPDVLDRSALGTAMYFSTRGFVPTTAITGAVDTDRDPGIVTYRTLFGYDGRYSKTTSIRTGVQTWLCEDADAEPDPDHDHDTVECIDELQNPPAGTVAGDEANWPIGCDPEAGHEEPNHCEFHGHYLGEVDTVDPHGTKSLSFISGGF